MRRDKVNLNVVGLQIVKRSAMVLLLSHEAPGSNVLMLKVVSGPQSLKDVAWVLVWPVAQ